MQRLRLIPRFAGRGAADDGGRRPGTASLAMTASPGSGSRGPAGDLAAEDHKSQPSGPWLAQQPVGPILPHQPTRVQLRSPPVVLQGLPSMIWLPPDLPPLADTAQAAFRLSTGGYVAALHADWACNGHAGIRLTSVLPGSFAIVDPASGDSRWVDASRLNAVRLESEALVRQCQQARARAGATRDQVRRCRSQRETVRNSAPARRQAGAGCIPVIEQAKGIVMAQQGCRPEQAFDLLHRASQRAGIRVHVLAAQIVRYLASGEKDSNVTPISLGAIRRLR